jgi:riboflavin kinase/FMN adenylyltransferase
MYNGMLNIGNNPTIEGKGRSLEVNIFDFDQNIYGDEATIYFIERLRDEVKFNGLDQLKVALAQDKVNALKILNC